MIFYILPFFIAFDHNVHIYILYVVKFFFIYNDFMIISRTHVRECSSLLKYFHLCIKRMQIIAAQSPVKTGLSKLDHFQFSI